MKRQNSAGFDLTDAATIEPFIDRVQHIMHEPAFEAAPIINGSIYKEGKPTPVQNPANTGSPAGHVWFTDPALIEQAFESTRQGFAEWSITSAATRGAALEKYADLMEADHEILTALLISEAGKTIGDAHDEIREAIDFCRYYAATGHALFKESGQDLTGPTGETNRLTLHGRGVFVCISPWNFPLAIFTGPIAAALMAGNAVIAKPAEQTPLIAMRAAELMKQAGIPANAIIFLPGDGALGAALARHPDTAGVAFTGSTETAWRINQTLAAKKGPIVPLIAETGGQNAMIVDSSALPEQITDDVILSAFGSAGQRCSALRVLYLQEDIADKVITMLTGAMAELRIGNPANLSTDVGPVIDEEALNALRQHRAWLDENAHFIAETPLPNSLRETGYFFAPIAFEIDSIKELSQENFGPILHVIRYPAKKIDSVIDEINATGYGLTAGIHSRIGSFIDHVSQRLNAGNIYVNRSMTGAVVGVQPFGGRGLSGTGPKAGGPHYLLRFATEKTISTDTTRQGGNASLVALEES